MTKPRILVCDPLPEPALEVLRGIPADVTVRTGLDEEALAGAAASADALVIRSGVRVTGKVLSAGKSLRAVVRAGSGCDNVDLAEAARLGIAVMNTPGANAVATAEQALALLLACARHLPQAHASLAAGRWDRTRYAGIELAGKVLGVVGLGHVGREVVRRARAFEMAAIAHDPFVPGEEIRAAGAEPVSFDELVRLSDFVTLHAELSDSTRHLIGRETLAKMKKGVRIVNCARGGLVDAAALREALDAGQVAAAAVDVFEAEPPPADHPLLRHERVVATPHLGASTDEALERAAGMAAEQLRAFLTDGTVTHGVKG